MSLTTAATPSTGYLVAYDVDNILKQKDQFGVITQIGSTALGGGINFTTGDGLTFSGSTLSVWVDNSTIQINGLGRLEAINFGPTGPSGARYKGTSSTIIEVPIVGSVINFDIQPDLAYTYGQSVVMFDYFPGLYVDDYTVDTYGGYIIGEVDDYDKITGSISVVVNYSESVGNTYSQWYVNLSGYWISGSTGSQGVTGPTGSQGITGATGPVGDRYRGTSSTTIEVPSVGYVVNFQIQSGLAYSYGQSVVMFDYFPGLYIDDYVVDTYGGYMIGEVDSYDPISGTMAIVVNYSESVGNTYSQWWVNLAGAYTTISGSDNYVPYYTSSTTLSSTSSIYVTGSNVGIGTITPSAKLHIVGTSSVVNGLLDSSNISLLISNSSGQQSLIVKNDRSVSVNGSAWPYLSYTSSILTISGRTSDSSEYATIWTDSNSNYLAFFRNDGIFSFSRPGTGISKVGINVLPSSVVNDLQVSGTGSFYSVGVGTTTPSYPLHVIGTVSSTTGYNIGATAGFTGTGTYNNFTIIGGIIVSAS